MDFKIYDDQSLEDVLVTGSHDYENDEFYLKVEDHNLISIGLDEYDDAIDNPEFKRELFEHPERFTLDGKPITEITLHRYQVDTEENGDKVYQIEVVLYN